MKVISLISLFILLSISHAKEVSLTPFVVKFLPQINQELLKPITYSKTIKGVEVSFTINFNNLTKENINATLEQSDLIHLKIIDLKAEGKPKLKAKISRLPMTVTGKVEIKTTIDMKLKIGTKVSDGKKVTTAEISYFKTDTNIVLISGKFKINVFNEAYDDIKKIIEQQIADRFIQKELQKIIDKNIDKIF